ncbi:MAG: 50S ribosomal protein L6 [Clostridiales bacterium]|nr:50S ribosomal protein L6 [Clostridiales bacterium]
MSRIGREPITIPSGVEVTLGAGNEITVKGPLGTLCEKMHDSMTITRDGDVLTVTRPNDDKEMRSLHGLTRALLFNMVQGVTQGYSKKLEINGVGYRAEKSGTKLNLKLGFSHDVIFEEGDSVTFEVPDANTVIVKSPSKQKCGEIAAQIRKKRPPEPYLGKGVKYETERIRRKAGKAGK